MAAVAISARVLVIACVVIGCECQAKLEPSPFQEDASLATSAQARWDRIEVRRDQAAAQQTFQGRVLELDRQQIVFELDSGATRTFPRQQVIDIQLGHWPQVVAAEALAEQGDFNGAVQAWEKLISARDQAVPDWLRRYAATRRIQAQSAIGQYGQAGVAFLALHVAAPEETPWFAAPLAWSATRSGPLLDQQIARWLAGRDPAELLLAGSHGLQHPRFADASGAALEKLASGEAGDLRDLALAQLWRLETQPSPATIAAHQQTIAAMDAQIAAGPWFLLGRQRRQLGLNREASLDFLRVATLYPQQHDLVLLGLDGAYLTLKSMQDSQAPIVGRWLIERFPDSPQSSAIEADLR